MKYLFLLVTLLVVQAKGLAQNTGVDLDGVNDYISTTHPGFSGNAPRSIEAWIKTTANCDPNSNGIQNIIADMGTFNTGGRFTFNILWNNALRIEVGGSGLGGSTPINDGLWHHVAVTYNPTSTNSFKLYVDGVLDGQGNITTLVNTIQGTPIQFGKRIDNARMFDGALDEIRVYNYERSASEISADFNNQLCTPITGLVAYYKFNNGSGGTNNTGVSTSLDYSGNGYTATFNNMAMSGSQSNFVAGPTLNNPNASYNTVSLFNCNSILAPSGTFTISQSGTYTDVISNLSGCDSIITINATIGKSYATLQVHSCGPYTAPSGAIFNTPGTKHDTLFGANAAGCDSILTIQLTIGPSFGTFSPTACDSFVLPSGTITYQTGLNIDTLPNANVNGCDSIIYVYLTLNAQTADTIPVTSCDTFVTPQGQTITATQLVSETYTSSTGCDSLMVYNVSIQNSVSTTENISACDSIEINNTWYFTSQQIELNLSSASGCDSTAIINLTVDALNATAQYVNNELVANQVSGGYQWINCATQQAIAGANSATFSPTENGSYAVVVSNATCSDTSACVEVSNVSVADIKTNSSFEVFPNPATNAITVLGNTIQSVAFYNLNGQQMLKYLANETNEYSISVLPVGSYIVRINTSEGQQFKQIIVTR